MARKPQTPEQIEAEIKRLRDALPAAKAKQTADKLAELDRLVSKAGLIDSALAWARSQQRQASRPMPSRGAGQ